MKNSLFLNKKVWNTFSDKEMIDYREKVFAWYRQKGFPYFPRDQDFRNKEFKKFMKYDEKALFDEENKVYKQTMHGLSLCWSYFPHSWSIQCNNMRTPYDVFHDDSLLRKVIEKRTQMGDNISDNGIRKMLKIFTGTQSVSNFRPTVASTIYKKYCKPSDTVLDFSSGFGGRLLGAIKADVNYIGIEPSSKTFDGLTHLANDFGKKEKIILINKGSEDVKLDKESIDFAFSSPPYFNTEKYAHEETQSWLRFPDKESWTEYYLRETIKNVFYALKKGTYFLINIKNVQSYKNLEEVCIKICEQEGFSYKETHRLALSNINLKNKVSAYKYEPIFIFKKNL